MGKAQVIMPFGRMYEIVLCGAWWTSDRLCWTL